MCVQCCVVTDKGPPVLRSFKSISRRLGNSVQLIPYARGIAAELTFGEALDHTSNSLPLGYRASLSRNQTL